jgi:drug/metabolite transporter (DMT)-like permease
MGLAVASTSLAVMTLSGPGQLGRNTSSLQVGDALGVALATGLAGSVFVALREQGNPQLTYGCLVGICLLCAIGAVGAALRIGPVRNDSAGVG